MGKKGEEVKEKEEKSCTREGRMEEKERERERAKKNPKYLYPVCYKAPRGTKRRGLLWRGRSNGGRFRQLSH